MRIAGRAPRPFFLSAAAFVRAGRVSPVTRPDHPERCPLRAGAASAARTLRRRDVRARTLAFAALVLASGGASAQGCIFTTGAVAANFGALDPASASTRTATATVRIFCLPLSTAPIWQFVGSNGNAPPRMRHASQPAFIPYSLSTTSLGNTGFTQNWRITATVLGGDYENAPAGDYNDRLTATILP